MEMDKIYYGNSFNLSEKLEDKSIDNIITSPPYWGLRDYGTATWVGGNENCSHHRDNKLTDKNITGHSNLDGMVGDGIYKDICKKCGAKRIDSQLGLEKTPEEYVEKLVKLFRLLKPKLKDDCTVWLNLGDSYVHDRFTSKMNGTFEGTDGLYSRKFKYMDGCHSNGPKRSGGRLNLKTKDLCGIPWRVAFALQKDGWYLRQDIIWHKPNPMPESVKDRCTKAHEYIFLLTKSARYYYDADAIREPANYDGRKDTLFKGSEKYKNSTHTFHESGHERWNKDENGNRVRNKRSVWTVTTKPFKEAHFATFPPDLIEPCILTTRPDAVILDPFMGAGTVGVVAKRHGRNYIGFELNPEYIEMANKRIFKETRQLSIL